MSKSDQKTIDQVIEDLTPREEFAMFDELFDGPQPPHVFKDGEGDVGVILVPDGEIRYLSRDELKYIEDKYGRIV